MRAIVRRLALPGLALALLALGSPASAAPPSVAGSGRLDAFSCNVVFEFCICDPKEPGECDKMEDLVCKTGTKDCNSSLCWCDLKATARPGRSKGPVLMSPTPARRVR